VTLGGGWRLQFNGLVGGALEVSVGIDGVPAVDGATDGDRLRIGFRRPDRGPAGRLGPPGGPGVNLGAVGFGGELVVDSAGGLVPTGWASVERGSIELTPGALAGLLPGLSSLPLAVELDLDPERGATIGDSTTLRVRLPAPSPTPALAIDSLELALGVAAGDASLAIDVDVITSIRISLPGVPVELRFDGHGLRLPFSFDDRKPPGFHGQEIGPVLPTGAGLKLDLPVLRGAGRLSHRTSPGPPPRDDWAGALSVSLPPMSASAYGVLGLPGDGRPFSLLVVLGATFPPPGIQLGFGFAVSGIGGVVGINRRIDREALLRAVADGTAANLLFPSDPVHAGDAVIDALPAIFPPMRGAVVAGPMLQLSWGGRMVSASVAVLMESSDRVRLTVLGKLVVAIPDPEAPLILIQATFAGQIDPGVPSVDFVASLTGSHIVSVPLSGDLFLLIRGGGDPAFVLSAGGFHPAFAVPRGVPQLRRIGMDLSPSPIVDLRCEAYFAVTSNTVQFGARLELVAQVAGCGLRGHLGLDVLVQRHPTPVLRRRHERRHRRRGVR
jgi:hypothetical protein